MLTFATPSPIDLAIKIAVGALTVIATDRDDTVVTVSPTSPNRPADVRGAEETTVTLENDRLTIKGPKPRLSWIGPTESIDVTVELPTGSRLTAEISFGGARTTGRLGATRIKAAGGGAELDATGDLWLRAGHGNATVGTADGDVEIIADHGQVRVGTITGEASIKASHGSVQIAETRGEIDAKLSYGDITIDTALASVTAKTAYGSIQLGEISAGSVQVDSGYGAVSIGVRPGVAAWLDLRSKEGRVRNELDGDPAAAGAEQSVAVRARTQFGTITIQRAKGSTK
jgi:hypothetical protein